MPPHRRRLCPRRQRPRERLQRDVRLRMLAENSGDVYFSIRFPEGRHEYISPSVQKLFGVSQQDFYDNPATMLRIVAPAWRAQVRAWLEEIRAGMVRDEYEYQVLDTGGRLLWLRQRQVFVPRPDGSAWLLQGVAQVVPRSRRDEAVLRESEERLRALAEGWGEQVVLRLNLLDGSLEHVSHGIERITGRRREEFLARPEALLEAVAPQWREQAAAWIKEVREGLVRPEYEYEVLHAGGERSWVNQRGMVLRDAAGVPVAAQFVLFDITARRRLEDALAESNRRLALLADNMVDVIWALDLELRWTFLSPSVAALTGWPAETFAARPLEHSFPPESLRIIHAATRDWREAEPGSPEDGPRTLLIEVLHADGARIPVEVLGRSLRDASGRVTGYCGTTRDLRPRQRLERREAAISRLARELLECDSLTQAMRLTECRAREAAEARSALAAHKDPEDGRLLCADGPLPEVPAGALAVPVLHAGEEIGRIVAVDASAPAAAHLLERAAALFAQCVTRIRAEEALRKSERLWRNLLESMHEGVWAMDRDMRTIFVNRSLCAMLGYAPEEMQALNPYEVLAPHQRQMALERLQERRLGTPGSSDYDLLRRDGGRLPAHVGASPILDREGGYEGLVCTVLDLSQRKRLEEELRRNQARFEALFELSRLTTATEAQMASFALREAMRLTGSTAGVIAFVGADGHELTPVAWNGTGGSAPGPSSDTDSPWGMVAGMGKPLILNELGEYAKWLPPGHPPVTRYLGVPALDGERTAAVLGLTGTGGEYTQDDSLQAMLLMDGMWRIVRGRRDEARIRASLSEKEALLREVQHRVKNNLQVVSSLLDMAGRRLPDREARRGLEEVRAKVQAMSLAHALLHSGGRQGAGVDLAEYVRALFRQLREVYASGMELSLKVQLEEPLVLGLEQAAPLGLALNEALANVFKHARREGRPGQVDIRAWREEDGLVRLEVRDDGPGLPPGLVPERARSLGLKLMHGLVRTQLGGALSLENAAAGPEGGPRGACVRIVFRPSGAR